jgi:hypothetical protein
MARMSGFLRYTTLQRRRTAVAETSRRGRRPSGEAEGREQRQLSGLF